MSPRPRAMGTGRSVTLSPAAPGSPVRLLAQAEPGGCGEGSAAAAAACAELLDKVRGLGRPESPVGRELTAVAGWKALCRRVKGHPPLSSWFWGLERGVCTHFPQGRWRARWWLCPGRSLCVPLCWVGWCCGPGGLAGSKV